MGVRTSSRVDGALVLVLNNTPDAIEQARQEITAHLQHLRLSLRTINHLEVILEELVSNVLRYGLEPGGEHSILVAVTANPERILVVVEDDGVPFDPFSREDPAAPSSLEDAKVGGLGIPLVRRFSTDVRYEREPRSAAWRQMVDERRGPINRVAVTLAAAS